MEIINSDQNLCYGATIQYYDKNKNYTRQEEINLIANNRFACEKCKEFLSTTDKEVCEL